jgi:ABC-type multidrug transport system fused ATPase/permease subunit
MRGTAAALFGAAEDAQLSPARRKAAIARAALKRPDLLILNEAASALDGQAQAAVTKGLQEEFAGRGISWALHRPSLARNCDRVLVMSNGTREEQGVVPNSTKRALLCLY